MNLKKVTKYFFLVCLVFSVILFFAIIKDFLLSLFLALIFVVVFEPVYAFMNKHIKNRTIAGIILTVALLLLVFVPFILISNLVVQETINFYGFALEEIPKIQMPAGCTDETAVCEFINQIDIQNVLKDALTNIVNLITKSSAGLLKSITNTLIQIVIMFLAIFFIFVEKDRLLRLFSELVPLKKEHKDLLITKFKITTRNIIYGAFLAALIQGSVGALGFYLFGIKSALFWGIIMTLLALIPLIGPAFIWVPASLFLIYMKDYFNGIGLFLYGLIIVSTVDNIIKSLIIGEKSNLHPFVVFLCIIGGIQLFGVVGILIGPIIAAILTTFVTIYKEEYLHIKNNNH